METDYSKYDNTYRVLFVDETELKGQPANTLRVVANGLDIDSITRVDTLPTNPSEEKIYEVNGKLYYYNDSDWHQVADGDALAEEIEARQQGDANLQTQVDALEVASDVKDVVGTKAELDNYDTSTLSNDDIIKVLVDETHDDKTAYYRYNQTLDSFTFVGAISPYYTKSEMDDLLAEKQNKIDSSHKLNADLVDDTTSQNKFITDAQIQKLAGIEDGAEVNVQADWSETDSSDDAFIKNKPDVYTKSQIDTALAGKQNTLTAGSNITLQNDTISADFDALSNQDWNSLFGE